MCLFQFSGTNLENLGAFVNTCLVLARIKGMEADSAKTTGMAGWSSQNNEKGVDNIVQYNIGGGLKLIVVNIVQYIIGAQLKL